MTTVLQYFTLQLSMLKRQLLEWGLNFILAAIIIFTGFYGFSAYLFFKTTYANYFYIFIALNIVFRYSETNRNNFLKFTYPLNKYFTIRFLENLITVLPFIFFLCFKKNLYPIVLLIVLSTLIIFLKPTKLGSSTIPTPFYKKPFEFIVGFRKSFAVFLFSYFLTTMSLMYHNFNLGIFSMLLLFLVCFTFYLKPENQFYVWIYNQNVNQFLFSKVKTAIVFSTIISLPIIISLLFFYPTNSLLILGFWVLGCFYLLAVILGKYANYPNKINLPQSILLIVCFTMPPLLLLAVPYFYTQSYKKIKEILE